MALEDYLNSRPLVDFDDETRQIRAETDKLRRRIHTSIPHPRKSAPLQFIPYYSNSYDKVNITSNRPHHPMVDDILYMSYYSEPSAKTIGRGHLACVTFAGGRGYPRRRNHYFSDEYRDIGEEIRTRSYYNNSFTKSYVDSMSLPTGYASYLLRLKPPESNGTLTNLDKMHIIALAEERKRNIKRNKTDGDLNDLETKTKLLNGFPGAKEKAPPNKLERQLSKPEVTSKKPLRETNKDVSEDESSDSVSRLTRQDSDNRLERVVLSKEEVSVDVPLNEEPEPPKPEKKVKQKKNSLSRNASLQEAPKEKVEEVPQKQDTEKIVLEDVNDVLITSEPGSLPEDTEEFKSSSESEPRTSECHEGDKPSENLPLGEIETEALPPEAQSVDTINVEQTVEEPYSSEQPVQEEEKKETDVSSTPICEETPIEAISEELAPAEANQEEEEEVLPSELNKEEVTTAKDEVESIPTPFENREKNELTENITELSTDDVNIEILKENEQIKLPENEQVELPENEQFELPENEEKDNDEIEEITRIPLENDADISVVPNDSEKEGEIAITKCSQTKTAITETTSEGGTEVTSTVITSTEVISTVITSKTEVTVSENIVEDESRTSESEITTKENQPEPLIEEPQSPCDADIITNKMNSNDICEVLSDVPEES